jgi:glycosyltransferase involved in cell wall biosynthesis
MTTPSLRPAPAAARVVHVITESVPFGGAQRNTLLTVERLVRSGWSVELVCGAPGGRLVEAAARAGAMTHVIPELVRTTAPWTDVHCLARLVRLFRSRRYDVVHTHSTKAGLLGRLAARAVRAPVVIHTFHGFPFVIDASLRSRVFVQVERLVGALTDGSICVAEALRREVESWRIPGHQKLVTIYSGIDLGACRPRREPADVRRELGIDPDVPIVGTVGHLRDAKSQEHLLEAAAILRREHPRLQLLVVGEGERRGFLEQRIRELSLEGTARLLGERNDVADLLGVFDVFAMCSLWEGVGRALTEAMARGLPVVVTPVYGVKELVHDGETGLTVPPRDPAALAAAIGRLLADRALADALGARARSLVEERMSAETMMKEIEALYRELLAKALVGRELLPCVESQEG